MSQLKVLTMCSGAFLVSVFLFSTLATVVDCVKYNELSTNTIVSENDIRNQQDEAINQLKNAKYFRDIRNLTSFLHAFGTDDGKQAIRSLSEAFIQTLMHENGRVLFQELYEKCLRAIPLEVSRNLIKIGERYEEIGSFTQTLSILSTEGENSPLIQLMNYLSPQDFDVTEGVQTVAKILHSDDPNEHVSMKIVKLLSPVIDLFFELNDIDMKAEGILKLLTSFGNMAAGKDGKVNPMAMLMPLMGMMGGQKDGGNPLQAIMGSLGQNKNGGANIMEGIMGLMNSGGKNNPLESLMGMLGGNTSGGGMEMMGMMMSMMNGFGEKKKQNNDKIEMLSTVLDFMNSAGSGKKSDFGGLADMAMNFIGNSINKKETKKEKPVRESKPTTKSTAKSSKLSKVLEETLQSLQKNKASHPKLELALETATTMFNRKSTDAMTFITSVAPMAISQIPGGGNLLQEIIEAFEDMGVKNKPFHEILASVTNEGECMSLARKAAPHASKVVMLLSDDQIQETILRVGGDQAAETLKSFGMAGVTLSNWPERLGPMIGMLTMGMPFKPVAVLSALQEYFTLLLTDVKQQLADIREMERSEVIKMLELELGTVLHTLGSVEHNFDLQKTRGDQCLAQVVCRLCQKQEGVKAAIINTYSAARGLSIVSPDVPTRLLLLRASAFSGHCETEFPCSSLPKKMEAHHSSLDFEEAGHHQEL